MPPRYTQFRNPIDGLNIVLDPTDSDSRPFLYLDGKKHVLADIKAPVSGRTCAVFGAKGNSLERICRFLDVEDLRFRNMQIADLSPLSQIKRLKQLQIWWNTKITSLSEIGQLSNLEFLSLCDTKKITDLSPLASLRKLEIVELDGGIWNVMKLATLEPLAELPSLEELYFCSVRVENNGLRPIAKCGSLKYLALPHGCRLEDYAFLSVSMPNVHCNQFKPWFPRVIDKDQYCLPVAKGFGPMKLNEDGAKITKLEEKFEKVQASYAAEIARGLTL